MRPYKTRSTRDGSNHTQLAKMSFDEILDLTAAVVFILLNKFTPGVEHASWVGWICTTCSTIICRSCTTPHNGREGTTIDDLQIHR